MKHNKFVRRLVSIHPLYRQMEWKCRKDKKRWLHEDVAPTVTAHEDKGGNVIWHYYETE